MCKGLVIGLLLAAVQARAADTLCSPDEEVVFSCRIKNSKKSVSVCSSNELTNTVGYLQYRFGTPEHVELTYPNQRTNTQEKFYYHGEPLTGIYELTFQINQYFYTVGHYISAKLSEVPEGTNEGDVVVRNKDTNNSVGLECANAPQGYMGGLGGVVRDIDELKSY